jgi:hypothetical protein
MKNFICVHVVAVNGDESEEAYMVIDNDIVYAVSDEHNLDQGKATLMLCYPGCTTPVTMEVTETIEDVVAMINNCRKEA